MTENSNGVRPKKVLSKINQGLQHGRKEEEVGTLLLGNDDKDNVIINYLLSYLSKRLSKVKDK